MTVRTFQSSAESSLTPKIARAGAVLGQSASHIAAFEDCRGATDVTSPSGAVTTFSIRLQLKTKGLNCFIQGGS